MAGEEEEGGKRGGGKGKGRDGDGGRKHGGKGGHGGPGKFLKRIGLTDEQQKGLEDFGECVKTCFGDRKDRKESECKKQNPT